MTGVRRIRVGLLAAAVALVLVSCGDAGDPALRAPAATVNGTAIEAEVAIDAIRALTGADPGATSLATADAAPVLDQLVAIELLRQEVARRDLPVTDEIRQQARTVTYQQFGTDSATGAVDPARGEQEFAALPKVVQDLQLGGQEVLLTLAADLPDEVTGVRPVTDEEVAAVYDERAEQFSLRCLRVIIVDPNRGDPTAQQARGEEIAVAWQEGGSFEDLLAEESPDPSVPNGGDLSCASSLQLGEFGPTFAEAVFGAEVGAVVGPLDTAFGVAVVEVYDAQVQTLDDVANQLRAELEAANDGLRIQAVLGLLNELAAEAEVDVDPRFGRWVPVDDFGVPLADDEVEAATEGGLLRWAVVAPLGPLDPPAADQPVLDPLAVP